MAITIGPNLNMPLIGRAGHIAGAGDYERFRQQQALNEEELRQRERIADKQLTADERKQLRQIAAEEEMQTARLDDNQRGREFGLGAQKEMFGLESAEAQKAREFGYLADDSLQDQRLAQGYYNTNANLMAEAYRLQQQGQLEQMKQIAAERRQAAELQFRGWDSQFDHAAGIQDTLLDAQIGQQSALGAFNKQTQLERMKHDLQLALEQGRLSMQEQQRAAQILRQTEMIENQVGKTITREQADQAIGSLISGIKIPGPMQPPQIVGFDGQPVADPSNLTGPAFIYNPNTGSYQLYEPPRPETVSPETIVGMARDIYQGSADPFTKQPTMTWDQAMRQAQQLANGQAGGGLPPVPPGGGQPPPPPYDGPMYRGLPLVIMPEQYASLRSGQEFYDPNGNKRVKP